MGESTPRALQNAAFFVVGKMFSLRGGAEHRNLKISQLKRQYNPDHYVYYENVSKNNSGSFKKMRVKGKVVPVYSCQDAGSRCPIHILDTYLKAYESNLFYLRPLAEIPADTSKPWYAAQPIGRDTLQNKLRTMCKLAGSNGSKTNHSLRAAGATQMYDCEKIIQERTGHRSLDALRMYERTNVEQQQAVSAILTAPQSIAYNKSTEKMTIAHSISETKQPTNIAPSLSFQNLHGCTININAAAPPSHGSTVPTTTVTEGYMELDIDKIIASIIEDF